MALFLQPLDMAERKYDMKENEEMLLKILNKKFHPDIFYLLSIVNSKLIDENSL